MGQRQMKAAIVAVVTVCLSAFPAWAVKSETWTHHQPKDFNAGKLEGVVVNTLGEVMLGRETKTLLEAEDDEAEVINALVRAGDGKIYAATGPKGVIYQLDGDKVTKLATLPDGGTILSLLFTQDGRLLAGTGGGDQARIYTVSGDGATQVFYEPKGARYVWSMARGAKGEIYAATGIEGELHVVDADGSNGKVLADLKPKNVLCLAFGTDAMLYAGTDGDGLIYRVNPESGKTFVMYDAKEAEISSIAISETGVIYAATAAADKARPGKTVADKPGGKPAQAPSTTAPETRPKDAEGESPATQESDKGSQSTKPTRAATLSETLGRLISGSTTASGSDSGGGGGDGNAIYRIDTSGFVTEVFREPVMILSIVEADGTLYAGTGNEGRIYSITPAEEETVMLAKLEPNQATSLLRLPSGELLVGTANPPTIVRISKRYAAKGTLVSKPLDAGQIAKWGRVLWYATVPTGTKLTLATRSSNLEDEESESWEEWSAELDATSSQQISSVGARFLQYRLTFETTVPEATPVLRRVEIAHIEENRAPRVTNQEILSAREEAERPGGSPKAKAVVGMSGFGGESSGPKNPDYYWVIKWKAEDPNSDTLQYEVYYRQMGTARWIRMEKDLKETIRIWDTRTLPDGRYEVKVVASDSPGNPPGTALTDARISDPMVVDNTPPDATIDSVEVKGRSATLNVVFEDALTAIADAQYSIDSDEEWKDLAADDDIFDSLRESVSFTINDLEPGEHRIAIRARDKHGNARYVTRMVTIQ